jgi:hypothetical protein
VISIAQFFVSIVGFVALVWAIGAVWNHWWWIRDGRPTLSKSEQLDVDILRAARREVIKQRESEMMTEIADIRETENLLFNPERETELRGFLTDKFDK